MKRAVLIFTLFALAAMAMACDEEDIILNPFEERKIPEELAADAASVVNSNTRFALDFYAEVSSEPGNLFFSPFSISTALAMVYAGAAEVTESELADVFHFPLEQEQLHPAYGALVASLNRGTDLGGYELSTANGLWLQQGFPFLESFVEIPTTYYDAILETLNYAADPEGSRGRINGWVADKTRGRIEDLFPSGSITQQTVFVLANAIYFKGRWASEFDPDRTREESFKVSPDMEVRVPMMHQTAKFDYADFNDLKVLEMPYVGEDISMILFLPETVDGLPQLEAQLTVENMTSWISSLRNGRVGVTIPKFSMTIRFRLKQVLSAMGMPSAFSAGQADFSGMTGSGNVWIDDVFHKAFVEVNEEGTEAAAATGVGGPTSGPPGFVANHPFIFVIYDNVTGSVLFMGRVIDPSA
jgi:serpin B